MFRALSFDASLHCHRVSIIDLLPKKCQITDFINLIRFFQNFLSNASKKNLNCAS